MLQHKSYTSNFKNSGYKVKVNVNIPLPLNPTEVTVEIMMKTGIKQQSQALVQQKFKVANSMIWESCFELLIAQKSVCALGLCITL